MQHFKEHARPPLEALTKLLALQAVGWLVLGFLVLVRIQLAGLPFQFSDKLAHLFLFSGTTATCAAFALGSPKRKMRWFLVGLTVFALSTELAQATLTSNRRGEVDDFLADVVGISIGATGAYLAWRIFGPRLTQWLIVGLSVFGLAAVFSTAFVSTSTFQAYWQCRDVPAPTETWPGGEGATVSFTERRTVELSATPPPPIRFDKLSPLWCDVIERNSFTTSLWVRSFDLEQSGPTRIVTSSVGPESGQVNFHLGQQKEKLSVRFRTGNQHETDWELSKSSIESDRWTHVALGWAKGDATLYVDGKPDLKFKTSFGSISGWDKDFPLLIGDELTGERSFVGDITDVVVTSERLTNKQIQKLALSRPVPE